MATKTTQQRRAWENEKREKKGRYKKTKYEQFSRQI